MNPEHEHQPNQQPNNHGGGAGDEGGVQPFNKLSDAVTYIYDNSANITPNMALTTYQELLREQLAAYTLETADTTVTEDNYHAFSQIACIGKNEEVVVTLKELEAMHRIFSAADMKFGTQRPSHENTTPLHFDAAIQFVSQADLRVPVSTVHRSYGNNVADETRPIAINLFLRACSLMSTIWGFFLADEEPGVHAFVSAMTDLADNRTPLEPALQISPMFSRLGALLGWNVAARYIDDEMEVRSGQFAETPCTVEQMRTHFVTAMRNAFSFMATTFSDRVEQWSWNPAFSFEHAEQEYDRGFKSFLSKTGIVEDPTGHGFSLRQHTARVRMLRSRPREASTTTRLTMSSSVRPSKLRRIDGSSDPMPVITGNVSAQQVSAPGSSSDHAHQRAEVVRAEQERCRRRMERRERNRMRNREITSVQLKERHMHNIRQLRHHLHGDAEEFFELDDPDSDNEEIRNDADIYLNCDKDVNSISAIHERIDLEVLYEEVLSHCVDPKFPVRHASLLSILRDHGRDNNAWLRRFIPSNLGMFLLESTRAVDALHYADHQKVIIHLETHFQLVTALLEAFPDMLRTRNPWPIVDQLDGTGDQPFNRNRFVLSVEQSNNTRLLTNLSCRSYTADHNVRRDLVNAFPGMTLCVGYFKRPGNSPESSPIMLFLCRYITADSDNLEHDNEDGEQLDNVKVYLLCSRYWSSVWTIGQGDIITLIPFSSFVSITRQLRAAHETYRLPHPIQRILFGTQNANVNGPLPFRRLPRSRQEYDQSLQPMAEIRAKVDAESLLYIDSLPAEVCDESQRRAICTTLAEIGSLRPQSTSVSAIFGPPGTGKSTSICLAIGAILHHSTAGHLGDNAKRRPLLTDSRNMIFSNDEGVRILVTSPSNQGVDELADKLKAGIRGKDGQLFFPKIVRIGRHNFDYGTLEDISVRTLALEYDHKVYSVNANPPRRNPSRQAMHALGEECVVYLCTTSTAAGPMLKNLRASFSVIFIDEAAHASEQDTLCALVAGARFGQMDRLHVVLVGDSNQLRPVYISQHPATTFVSRFKDVYFRVGATPISMQRQFVSMFERLYDRSRCVFSWLTHQYRSHPHMARITLAPKYADILVHPQDISAYNRPYNQVQGATPLQPLTVIDTRLSHHRREATNGAVRGLHNELEVDIVQGVLREIYANRGHSALRSRIIVTTPYRAQLRLLRERLNEPQGFLSQHPDLDVKVDTIDSMQGSERSIVIISLTRSGGPIGFLRDDNRVNVACTRAQHLLVIVGDISTMHQSRYIRSLYDAVLQGPHGTALSLYRPAPNDIDDRQLRWAEENVAGFGL